MFSVESPASPGQFYFFEFYHNSPGSKHVPGTGCKITIGTQEQKREERQLVCDTLAQLYFKDTFTKRLGRKYALSKAIRAAQDLGERQEWTSKEFRARIWEAYFSKTQVQ